jgi:hypothetical protein
VWPDLFLKGAQNVPKISQHWVLLGNKIYLQ